MPQDKRRKLLIAVSKSRSKANKRLREKWPKHKQGIFQRGKPTGEGGVRSCGGQVSTADLKIVVRRQGHTKVAPRKVAQHDKGNIACTNFATSYHAALGDSSKDPLSSDCIACN